MDENSTHEIVSSPISHEIVWGIKLIQDATFSFSCMKMSFSCMEIHIFMHENVIFMHERFYKMFRTADMHQRSPRG